MSQKLVTSVRRLVRHFGVDITRRTPTFVDLMRHQGIDTVLDVGANQGQFGTYLRSWGFAGRIVSFEPVLDAFQCLERVAASDEKWSVRHEGLGSFDGSATINVSQYSVFSSILPALDSTIDFDARAATTRQESIPVRRLETVWPELRDLGTSFYLKVDTQGFEAEVIRGAEACLSLVRAVQLELSFRPMYQGELVLGEMMDLMSDNGFDLHFAKPVQYDERDVSVRQLDCVFTRRAAPAVVRPARNLRGATREAS